MGSMYGIYVWSLYMGSMYGLYVWALYMSLPATRNFGAQKVGKQKQGYKFQGPESWRKPKNKDFQKKLVSCVTVEKIRLPRAFFAIVTHVTSFFCKSLFFFCQLSGHRNFSWLGRLIYRAHT